MKNILLTRDIFRNAVFQRDGHKCVICKADGQDAHHIIERRLFSDGGYYIDNGATVCGPCHIQAEQTLLSCEEIRESAGITRIVLPEHLYHDQRYTKWGDPILDSGMRVKGELFEDESVQKILQPVLYLYTNRVKYPRTWHLPWSPGATKDDRLLTEEIISLWNWDVVVTEKMDGENTNFYNDGLHARSIDYDPHPSRSQIKALHATFAHNIPDNWRICCENLTCVHSLKYTNLKSLCQVFGIWDGCTCLSWDDTITFAGVLDMKMVPVIYRGPFNSEHIQKLTKSILDFTKQEGYVVRPTASFQLKEFSSVVGKYVRARHVQTHGHWMRSKLEYNEVEA